VPEVIDRLVDAGLDSIPGGGAEILVDRVRRLLNCYGKATPTNGSASCATRISAGLRTTATMMYGTVETLEERIEHMMRLRAAAGRDGGIHGIHHLELSTRAHRARWRGGHRRRLSAHARPRAHRARQLRQPAGVVGHPGREGRSAQPGYGANDMGSVMIEENVVRAAGASYCMDEIEIVRNVENAGFAAKRRNMHYEILGDPIFRERAVPRMLHLAVARVDGDTSRSPEIGRYAARSAAEKKARLTGH
jgi:cyclic dehypoxanthinyl futalosine synthase